MITQDQAKELFLPLIEQDGSLFEKFQRVWVRPVIIGEKIITNTSDGKETENIAKDEDFVVQNQTTAEEEYIISSEKFLKRYKKGYHTKFGGWLEYIPTGTTKAIEFHPHLLNRLLDDIIDPFYFEAPWGERTIAKKGDMICTTDGIEVYRIARKEFEQTYRIKQEGY